MAKTLKPDWILLEYASSDYLDRSIPDREGRLLTYPAVGRMRDGQSVDVQITVEGTNVLFPMHADVLEVRERPAGPGAPRGVTLGVVAADRQRFDRLCAYIDGMWRPSTRRSLPRFPIHLKCEYGLEGRAWPAETLDLSARGMFLRTDSILPPPQTAIAVRLHPPASELALDLQAQVRWHDTVESRRGIGLLCTGPAGGLQQLQILVNSVVAASRA